MTKKYKSFLMSLSSVPQTVFEISQTSGSLGPTIRRYLNQVEKDGIYIQCERRIDNKPGQNSTYYRVLNMPVVYELLRSK